MLETKIYQFYDTFLSLFVKYFLNQFSNNITVFKIT